ncbi:glycosyltransferase family 87 protein [uncultured Corynebacterium sp.]|uniref:glycosyltransferase family 87 protein n=1 Tax=uncultured Corynebacterium sp. TaxID=159447 RepID=UPI00260FE962|nr:glycosyltransferase family 87 protein [uncultured Corynebacterium sp.]
MTISPTTLDGARTRRTAAQMLWPLTIFLIVHRAWVLPHQSGETDDFTTVWRALVRFGDGIPVYTANYNHVDPHYLYSPGGTLALQPVTWLGDYDTARMWFIFAQAAGIIAAVVLLLRWLGVHPTSWLVPLTLSLTFLTESVTSTLRFANVNGTLLFAQVLFIILLLRDRRILAGLVLGIAITVKPIVAPLLFLAFVRKDWVTIPVAAAVPVAFNIAAWPLAVDPMGYIERTLPYMSEVRLHANASIAGELLYFGVPELLLKLWLIIFAAPVIFSLILLLRWQWRDEKFWALTTSGVLMTGVLLLGSLGQQYYALLLLPTIIGVVHTFGGRRDAQGDPTRSVVANWPAALAVTMFYFSLNWYMDDYVEGSMFWIQTMAWFGWMLFSLTMFGALVKWTIEEHGAGRDWRGIPRLPGMDWFGRPLQWESGAPRSDEARRRASEWKPAFRRDATDERTASAT